MDFFYEFISRLFAKSPKFFLILQGIALFFVIMGYTPLALDRWFGICAGNGFINFAEDVSKYATGFLVASKLPAHKVNGKMPFTTKRDEKNKQSISNL